MNELPETMKAVVLTGHGDLDKLEYHENWPVPQIGKTDVLIRVHACGLNNTDVNTRTAWYSKKVSSHTTGGALDMADSEDASWGEGSLSFPRIQGADVAGIVVAAGRDTDASLLNKRVMIDPWLRDWDDPNNLTKYRYFGSESDGGFAEYTAVDYRQVHPVDCELSNEQIATFATSWVTAENMLNSANVSSDDVVLISGASGGVGSALVQLVNRRNATSVALTSKTKMNQLKELNPDFVIDRDCNDLEQEIKSVTGGNGVTVVADVVGGSIWPQLLNTLQRGGRYACSGAIAGPIVEFDLRTFYLRNLTFYGCTAVRPGVFENLVSYVQTAAVKPVLAATYPLDQLRTAQDEFIHKQHLGNIVVKID